MIIIILFLYPVVKILRVKSKFKTKIWSGHSLSLEKLLCNMMELKRWTTIDIRWKKAGLSDI